MPTPIRTSGRTSGTRARRHRPSRTLIGLVAGAAVLATTLAGCGGGNDDNDDKASAKSVGDAGGPASNPTGIVSASSDVNRDTKPSTTAVAVPSGGPTGIGTFPVPPGVNVKGPGPQSKSWQFDITTKDVAGVLAFYRKALAKAGYDVQNDVTKNEGAEVVKYDIAFTGKATGFIIGDQSQDDVFVVVQSLPGS